MVAYVIGLMNLILHGIPAPNLLRTDTLADRMADVEEKDRYNVILANPPVQNCAFLQIKHFRLGPR
ncbi:hypothetical protein ACEN2J_20530 [Pseudorhodobacter sp. W20_MBD10_FR17]|uniref:hypothetical protein n=1 Tax=Pseudorhodobacter sp. W20_MBD10_FR17 TaxID=3240266 RepID=UPI003F9B6BAA